MWPFTAWNARERVDEAIAYKRNQRSEAIEQGLQLAGQAGRNDPDSKYLSASACDIVDKIRKREWSCQRVMEAYVRSAAKAHVKTNCITEVMFADALQAARDSDARLEKMSEDELKDLPLFGLPMSLKDQLAVTGYDSCIGFAKYTRRPDTEDAILVQVLKNAGAIPFVKTNVPQTMLAFECANPVWGISKNPFSAAHVPGGSSGGEGAILALDGSPVGIGSDIGGSLRIPAHYSGCYGFKPVSGRWPSRGARGTIAGYEAILSTLGPMGRSAEDLKLITKAVYNGTSRQNLHATELGLIPLPYREVHLPQKLRFGYYEEDGFIPTSPACLRALRMTINALRAAGHTCEPIELPQPVRALSIFQALASSDGYRTLLSHISPGEAKEPALYLPTLTPKIPGWLRKVFVWIARTVAGEKAMAGLLSVSHLKPVSDMWQWQHQRNEFRNEVRNILWRQHAFDAVIAPPQAVPAVTHGSTKRLSPLAIHTIYWNVVDSTVGVIPVTRVDAKEDALPEDFKDRIASAGTKVLSTELYTSVYNSQAMAGLPIGVQIVAPAYEDEKVLEMMAVVDKALNDQRGQAFGPGITAAFASA